jgi:hypothetical protein
MRRFRDFAQLHTVSEAFNDSVQLMIPYKVKLAGLRFT